MACLQGFRGFAHGARTKLTPSGEIKPTVGAMVYPETP
jgi:hypothetical protein